MNQNNTKTRKYFDLNHPQVLKKKISQLTINSELINFIEENVNQLKTGTDKMIFLHLCKKLVLQVERSPDPDHYRAFEEEYENDRQTYDPIQWIEAELDYQQNLQALSQPQTLSSAVADEAKLRLGTTWLTKEEVMHMFKVSRSTLHRRIAEGMPCHKKGKFKYFHLEEISKWLKDAAA